MSFLMKDEKSFKKYNEILKKVGNIITKTINSELIYNKKIYKSWVKMF